MAADHTWKQGDNGGSALTDTLSYDNGDAVDLAGCTVALIVRSLAAAAPMSLTGVVQVVNQAGGNVQYTPSSADLATAGLLMANWKVTFPSGKTMTFPTQGYLTLSVEENLTTTGGQQLVSLGDVKEYLTIQPGDRTRDAKLVRFIEAVRPLVENITGPIIPTIFTEWHDGGQPWIQVRHRPSTSFGTTPVFTVMSVTEYQASTTYPLEVVADPTLGSTYSCLVEPTGRIVRRTSGGGVGIFAGAQNGVQVVYTAGQSSIPHNVYEAALETIRVNYQTTQSVGRGRMTVTDDLDTGPPLGFFMPRRVVELLSPNRRAPSIA